MPARVVLGVGAGIAAYKACELLRLLTESGHRVRVVPTPDALRFVGEATWAALSGEPVTTDVWTGVADVPHVRLGQSADLVLVAPATADLLARAAAGMAGDLLTATLLTARCPVLYAPAMHTEMWEHPATQANVAMLRSRGAIVLEPAVGRLTGSRQRRRAAPGTRRDLRASRLRLLASPVGSPDGPARGRRVVVSAGGTREEIDPVRFIGNWSTGTQGYALARTAVARGAEVTVVAANVALPDPAGAKVIRVVSARDMQDAVTAAAAGRRDAVVMAAAVADYRPQTRSAGQDQEGRRSRLSRCGWPRTRTSWPGWPGAARRPGRPGPRRVRRRDRHRRARPPRPSWPARAATFWSSTRSETASASATIDNEAVVYGADGTVTQIPRGPKDALADVVWDLVAARLR